MTSNSAAAAQYGGRQQSPIQRVQHLLHSYPFLSPAILLIITMAAFTALNSRFALPANLSSLMEQAAIVALLGVGQTLIILTAGIDLSCGAIAILSMMLMGTLASTNGVPGPLAIILGILFGVAAGFVNGLLITRLNLPPFIVTLGTLSVFTAVALLYSGGSSIQGSKMPDIMTALGNSFPVGSFRISYGVIVVVLTYIVVGFVLSQTAWGRHVYAVGDDAESARLSGVPSKRILISVYTVAGLIYGITSWVLIGRSGAATPNAIPQGNLESITAVVIGGTSLFGGRGRLVGTLLGALIVWSFSRGLSLAGVDQQWRLFAIGVLVIVAVSIDQWIRKVKA